MIKFVKFFLLMGFLSACAQLEVDRQYTEFYTLDGVGYVCEYVHGERISCKRKEQKDGTQELALAAQIFDL
uniref:Lipoprotein n=1 Tax=Dulem virus 76 TaxID=3145787 RepID=A0AAU8B0E0_9VIRU